MSFNRGHSGFGSCFVGGVFGMPKRFAATFSGLKSIRVIARALLNGGKTSNQLRSGLHLQKEHYCSPLDIENQ
jgi:hypothetical protein